MTFKPERTWVDHLLAISAGVLAAYSIAMSVNKSQMALVMASAVAICGIAGFILSRLVADRKIAQWDGWILAGGAMALISQSRKINAMLPDQGFPFELLASVIMLILLCVGSLVSWRDGTLLFLTLPGIVLFGLVGVIDWAPGIFTFCIFLILIATLYARVHQRTMIAKAEATGADPRLLRRGAWRWVAGPEYALLAASTILVLSFIAAPLVRLSLNQMSGGLQGGLRSQVRRAFSNTSPITAAPSDASVGNGPVRLSDTVLWQVKTDGYSYLRTGVFPSEAARGWDRYPNFDNLKGIEFDETGKSLPHRRNPRVVAARTEAGLVETEFEIRSFNMLSNVLPLPGPVVEAETKLLVENRYGVTVLETGGSVSAEVPSKFVCLVPAGVGPTNKVGDATLENYLQTNQVAVATRQLAETVSAGADTSWDKAKAIKTYISSTAQYNLKAPRVPQGKDPVVFFLSESKQGYCDLYATAFVQMARSVDLPARYVTGYLISPDTKQSDGSHTIREKDAHSWAEVYFDGVGWVPFDATEGTVDITPDESKGAGGSFLTILGAFFSHPIVLGVIASALGVLGMVLLFRSAPRERGVRSTRTEVHRHQLRLQRSIEILTGAPRRFSQTMSEYVGVVSSQIQTLSAEIMELNTDLERGIFGKAEPSEDEVETLKVRTDDLRRKLKQSGKAKA